MTELRKRTWKDALAAHEERVAKTGRPIQAGERISFLMGYAEGYAAAGRYISEVASSSGNLVLDEIEDALAEGTT